MYVLSNNRNYIGCTAYKDNIKATLRKFDWQITKVDETPDDTIEHFEVESFTYNETSLEKTGFDIVDFFKTTIETLSQLEEYALNMNFLEKEYNKKISDVRHYKRDGRTKLNAVQLQRLEQFEIQLERERYECKSNRIIAELFLTDLNRMEDVGYIEEIRKVKESEYKPKILTYEMIDDIVGKKNS